MHLEQQDSRSSRIRAEAMRNRNHETSPTEPTKRKEPGLPSARLTFVQRKTWKPASHQAKPNQKVLGERLRKSRTAAGFVPKPCETATTKTAETLPTEPTKRKEKELPSATLTFVQRKTQPKGAWGALAKKQNSSRIRAQAMRNRNRKNCRNVAYGTH